MFVQVFSSVPLPTFFRASNYRASVLQKWLNSSHYKSRVWFNPDLGLPKCIEFSSVLFAVLISTELFCTSNDRYHIINSQLSRGSLSAWWIPWTDTCTGLVWCPSLCLDLFSHSNHTKSEELGFRFEFGKVTTATQCPWSWANKSFATDLAASRAVFSFLDCD